MSSNVYELAKSLVEATKQGLVNKYVYNYACDINGTTEYLPPRDPLPQVQGLPQPLTLGWSRDGQYYSRAKGYPIVGFAGKPARSVTLTDCSGYIAYIIEQLAPQLYDAFCGVIARKGLTHDQPWPSADAYASLSGDLLTGIFEQIATQDKLLQAISGGLIEVGDIMAWSAPQGARDTGHVVVIAGALTPVQAHPNSWYIPVCDCSGIHLDDTRAPAGSGVGSGTVIFNYDPHTSSWRVSLCGGLPTSPNDPYIPGATPIDPTPVPPYVFYGAQQIAVLRLQI